MLLRVRRPTWQDRQENARRRRFWSCPSVDFPPEEFRFLFTGLRLVDAASGVAPIVAATAPWLGTSCRDDGHGLFIIEC